VTIRHRSDDVLVWEGDSLALLKELNDASIDAVVTDPPYGINFMGKAWDGPGGMVGQIAEGLERASSGPLKRGGTHSQGYFNHDSAKFQAWVELWAIECLRVLKPGGHLLAFGGTRTWHRLTAGIEDAGFEIRDSIAWLYGSGFPKSHDVAKHIDRLHGAARPRDKEVPVGKGANVWKVQHGGQANHWIATAAAHGEKTVLVANDQPITEDAARWNGWGTALKPAFEPVVVARKPLAGTVAANVLQYGTGALNIDGSRIGMTDAEHTRLTEWAGRYGGKKYADGNTYAKGMGDVQPPNPAGRWPANVVLDESQAVALDEQSGISSSPFGVVKQGGRKSVGGILNATGVERNGEGVGYGDTGGASRFFYVAKASRRERPKPEGSDHHPTVKPLALMRWLVKLVTPPGGIVLDPFAGSGTTVEACLLEGFRCMAMEREADYVPLILHRIERARKV
jgi:DNA modification methylase